MAFSFSQYKALVDQRLFLLQELHEVENDLINNASNKSLIQVKADLVRTSLVPKWETLNSECVIYNSVGTNVQINLFDDIAFQFKKTRDTILAFALDAKPVPSINASGLSQGPPGAMQSGYLKPISLPKLHNDNFEVFWEIFTSLVDQHTGLSKVLKFHYLCEALNDEGMAIIANFLPISVDTYSLACAALKDHFLNPRKVAMKHALNLYNMEALPNNHKNSELAKTINDFRSSTNALKSLNIPALDDFLLFAILYAKIDKKLRYAYEDHVKNCKNIQSYDSLLKFLQDRVSISGLNDIVMASKPMGVDKRKTSLLSEKSATTCVMCGDTADHRLYKCPQFLDLQVDERISLVRKKNICSKCLNAHSNACKFKYDCRTCSSSKHNTLLCKPGSNSQVQDGSSPVLNPPAALSCHINSQTALSLLSTATVLVQDDLGNYVQLKAIIDGGSQSNFITERAVQFLHSKRFRDKTIVNGLSGATQCRGRVSLRVTSSDHELEPIDLSALILKEICSDQPAQPVSEDIIKKFDSLNLADETWHTPSSVHLLLGVGFYSSILCNDRYVLSFDGISAVPTKIGYLLLGAAVSSDNSCTSLLSVDVDKSHELHQAVERLWELERCDSTPKPISPEDALAEAHYQQFTFRESDGRYNVRLPFKANAVALCENRYPVKSSFLRLEKRLSKDPEVAKLYREFFSTYISEDMMHIASDHQNYLLPHHPVMKRSTSTSVRAVFDCSSEDRMGNSLNQQLLKGPNLIKDIFYILLDFRLQPVPVVCDIKKMYNQVVVNEKDRDFQHIVWRSDPSEELHEYVLTRLTFGLVPSSFLAQRTIQQLVKDEGDHFPLAKNVLSKSIYVDDIVYSCPDIDTAVKSKNELIALMQCGGFELRKFVSSYPEVLADIPPEHCEHISFSDSTASVKLLGLTWNPSSDFFYYKLLPPSGKFTKRAILSYSASIYDVKGFLAPLTVSIRSFLQMLWLEKLEWDETFSDSLQREWSHRISDVEEISNFRIDRYIPVNECKELHIVGFADGSSIAHGASLYLRCVFENHASMHLVRAKGRVNPLKPLLTIPRVELQAATLLAELYDSITKHIKHLNITQVLLCTDSTIVLGWIHTPAYKLQTFVGNRVCFIQTHTDISCWRHIPSELNAADPISRGLTPLELVECQLYWQGPHFLSLVPYTWPSNFVPAEDPGLPELRTSAVALLVNVAVDEEDNFETNFVNRFSSLSKMEFVMAYVLRFINNCRVERNSREVGFLSTKRAKIVIVLQLQKLYLSSIYDGKVPKELLGLKPVVDDESDLIRVGGRLSNAPLPDRAKHPLIIPRESNMAVLICRYAHDCTLHGGIQVMRGWVQQHYWIVGITRLLTTVKRECQRCIRFDGVKSPTPLMADLPKSRFNIDRPFTNVSTDFAGPFSVHEACRPRAKMIKVYVCVYTCMATRATHLEVVHNLTTEAFLDSVDRMVSRRGLCNMIFCDNATNFVGASNALNKVYKSLVDYGNVHQIQFQFNAPLSPWKNGITERLVGIFKSHLVRVLGSHTPTYTEFVTLVTKIEAIMNSRPLIPLSVSDPEDIILTPGHFLVGSHLLGVPEVDVDETMSITSRWERVKYMFHQFWRLWKTSYLQTLMTRTKWHRATSNLSVGTLVIMRGDNSPPMQWPLAHIEEVYTHKDNTVRVVKLKTAHGTYVRPVNKLIVLDI